MAIPEAAEVLGTSRLKECCGQQIQVTIISRDPFSTEVQVSNRFDGVGPLPDSWFRINAAGELFWQRDAE